MRVWLNAHSDRRVLGRGLTVCMHCIKSNGKMFDSVLAKRVCCIVPSYSSGIVGV